MRFCWHKYTKWGKAIEAYGGSIHQVCSCIKCGTIKRRKAVSMMAAQLDAYKINEALKNES